MPGIYVCTTYRNGLSFGFLCRRFLCVLYCGLGADPWDSCVGDLFLCVPLRRSG